MRRVPGLEWPEPLRLRLARRFYRLLGLLHEPHRSPFTLQFFGLHRNQHPAISTKIQITVKGLATDTANAFARFQALALDRYTWRYCYLLLFGGLIFGWLPIRRTAWRTPICGNCPINHGVRSFRLDRNNRLRLCRNALRT